MEKLFFNDFNLKKLQTFETFLKNYLNRRASFEFKICFQLQKKLCPTKFKVINDIEEYEKNSRGSERDEEGKEVDLRSN